MKYETVSAGREEAIMYYGLRENSWLPHRRICSAVFAFQRCGPYVTAAGFRLGSVGEGLALPQAVPGTGDSQIRGSSTREMEYNSDGERGAGQNLP